MGEDKGIQCALQFLFYQFSLQFLANILYMTRNGHNWKGQNHQDFLLAQKSVKIGQTLHLLAEFVNSGGLWATQLDLFHLQLLQKLQITYHKWFQTFGDAAVALCTSPQLTCMNQEIKIILDVNFLEYLTKYCYAPGYVPLSLLNCTPTNVPTESSSAVKPLKFVRDFP